MSRLSPIGKIGILMVIVAVVLVALAYRHPNVATAAYATIKNPMSASWKAEDKPATKVTATQTPPTPPSNNEPAKPAAQPCQPCIEVWQRWRQASLDGFGADQQQQTLELPKLPTEPGPPPMIEGMK